MSALPTIAQGAPFIWLSQGGPVLTLPTIAQGAPFTWAVACDQNGNPLPIVTPGITPSNTSTQNNAAIAAAIAQLTAAGGGVLLIPYGIYSYSSIIIDSDFITIWGYGQRQGAPTFVMDPTQDPTWSVIVGNTKNVNSCLIHGLNFQGRNSTSSTGGGILFRSTTGKMDQVKVGLFGGTGIQVNSFSGTVFENYLEDINLVQNGMNTTTPGDNLVLGTGLSDFEVIRLISNGNSGKNTTRHCVNNQANEGKFVNCHVYFGSGDGFNQVGGNNTEIIGGEYENNATNGMRINGANIVTDADCFGNGNADIEMDSGDHCVIVGNKLRSNGISPNLVGFGVTKSVIANNTIQGQATSISFSNTCVNLQIHDNTCDGATNGISIAGQNCDIHDNQITAGNLIEAAGAASNNIHDNTIPSAKTITLVGTTTTQIRNNPGYNPQAGGVTTPAIPATATPIQNVTGNDVEVTIIAGTISAISIGNTSGTVVATGLTSNASGVTVIVKATQWISLTYTVAPTSWKWLGI